MTVTRKSVGCNHPWQRLDGTPAPCPDCLEREVESLQRQLTDAEQVRDQRWQMARDATSEVYRLQKENAAQAVEIERLRSSETELAAAVDEVGTALFGVDEGKAWRDAKASWWQRCVRAVEAAEKARQA